MFHHKAADLEKRLREYDRITAVDYLAAGCLGLSAVLGFLRFDAFAIGFFLCLGCLFFAIRWWDRRSLLRQWGAALQREQAEAAAEEAARAERLRRFRQES